MSKTDYQQAMQLAEQLAVWLDELPFVNSGSSWMIDRCGSAQQYVAECKAAIESGAPISQVSSAEQEQTSNPYREAAIEMINSLALFAASETLRGTRIS